VKAAILADIHGNSIALDEVLSDIQSLGGVDEYWLLGDYAAIGYDPVGVLERITAPPAARFLRGNTDRYLVTGDQPWLSFEEVKHDRNLTRTYFEVAGSFAWTRGAVGATGWLPWFRDLPLDLRLSLPDGSRLLAVHAAPGSDDGMGIHINTSDDELCEQVSGLDVEIVLVGHTHLPFDRTVAGFRVVNPGSVSNPFPPDLRASYALLEADGAGYKIDHRRVDYDREAVIKAVKEVNHPASGYIERFMRGENKKDWMK
jgi:predicted phosphodiesterase